MGQGGWRKSRLNSCSQGWSPAKWWSPGLGFPLYALLTLQEDRLAPAPSLLTSEWVTLSAAPSPPGGGAVVPRWSAKDIYFLGSGLPGSCLGPARWCSPHRWEMAVSWDDFWSMRDRSQRMISPFLCVCPTSINSTKAAEPRPPWRSWETYDLDQPSNAAL